MKSNFFILLILILLVQLVVPSYLIQLLIWIISGIVIAFKFPIKRLFLKAFLCGGISATILYFFFTGEIYFMENMANELSIPYLIFPLVFILFNALTIAFSFQVGTSLKSILNRR